MKVQYFSIYDCKTKSYMQPWVAMNLEHARYVFSTEINHEESPLFGAPEDYVLFHIGLFDSENATFANKLVPQPVATGLEVKESPISADDYLESIEEDSE